MFQWTRQVVGVVAGYPVTASLTPHFDREQQTRVTSRRLAYTRVSVDTPGVAESRI